MMDFLLPGSSKPMGNPFKVPTRISLSLEGHGVVLAARAVYLIPVNLAARLIFKGAMC
jgi:hypothetical protein